MRITLAILTAILFVLIGCSNTDNDTKEGWENLSGYDFPVYAGHFADYVQTDIYGNVLGNIDYGSNGDDKDWEWFEYSSKNSVTNNLITGISFSDTFQVVFSGVDPFLTPELDFFTAMVTNDYHVQLTWITQSETDVQGFNIHRSESNDFITAVVINDSLISSDHPPYQQHTYTYIDDTVELNHTYYYWRDQVLSDNQFLVWGPISVSVIYTGDDPTENKVYPAYPNPCNNNLNLQYSIVDSAQVNILVINQEFEVVRSYQGNRNSGSFSQNFEMNDLPIGLYRVFYWIEMNNKQYYSYGDVLKQ